MGKEDEDYGGDHGLRGEHQSRHTDRRDHGPDNQRRAEPELRPTRRRHDIHRAGRLPCGEGERIDNTTAAGITNGVAPAAYTNGGSVNILDQTVSAQGVAVMPGALIDVSGGWLINSTGKVTGGNAGSLTVQGNSLVLEGTLEAQSLVGNKGGAITLTAPNVTMAAAAPSTVSFVAGPFPDSVQGQLVLGAGALDASGFTNITLNSVNDLIVESGASLGPSLAKLAMPVPGSGTAGVQPGAAQAGSGVVLVSAEYIGGSSITLNAGKTVSVTSGGSADRPDTGPLSPLSPPLDAYALVYSGASIQTAPGGSITVSAPKTVEVGGSLSAPAGNITLKASGGEAGTGDVTLDPGASVLAEGYYEAGTTSAVKGLAADAVLLSGGTVSITAANNLTLSPGSLVSVSGSSPVEQTLFGQNNSVSYIMNASQPGSISLSAGGTIKLSLQADLEGRAAIAGMPGGTLSVSATGGTGATLFLAMSDLARFQAGGFDALTLSSAGTLNLSNPSGIGEVSFGRSLTLSAQTITGSGTDQIDLSAPWVQVVGALSSQVPTLSGGGAEINLVGKGTGGTGWLDVTGNVAFSGFKSVYLAAAQDMTFTDEIVSNTYEGTLVVSGDLTLQAARVYPATLSSYTVNAGGKVTVLPSGTTVAGPVYSAGGSLTIISKGAGIDQEGYLAAPMGTISLQAPNGRVYLGRGSTTTVSGGNINENASLLYGIIQMAQDTKTLGDNIWAIPDKAHPLAAVPYTAVQNVPAASVSLTGSEVIVGKGAVVDVSGGWFHLRIPVRAFLLGEQRPSGGQLRDRARRSPPGERRLSLRHKGASRRHLFAPSRGCGRREREREPLSMDIPSQRNDSHGPEDNPVDQQGDPHPRRLSHRRRVRHLHGHEHKLPAARSLRGETRLPRAVGRAV